MSCYDDNELTEPVAQNVDVWFKSIVKKSNHDWQALQNVQDLNIINESTLSRVERTPWIQRTGWLRFYVDYNIMQMTRIAKTTSVKLESHEENYIDIKESVIQMLKVALDNVKDCENRGWRSIRLWLESTDKNKMSTRPFQREYGKNFIECYSVEWTRLLYFCLRNLEIDDEILSMTSSIERGLEALRATVCGI